MKTSHSDKSRLNLLSKMSQDQMIYRQSNQTTSVSRYTHHKATKKLTKPMSRPHCWQTLSLTKTQKCRTLWNSASVPQSQLIASHLVRTKLYRPSLKLRTTSTKLSKMKKLKLENHRMQLNSQLRPMDKISHLKLISNNNLRSLMQMFKRKWLVTWCLTWESQAKLPVRWQPC